MKYSLRGFILGVLTHTTGLVRHWGDNETLFGFFSPHGPYETKGDPEFIFFTLNTYQGTLISDIL